MVRSNGGIWAALVALVAAAGCSASNVAAPDPTTTSTTTVASAPATTTATTTPPTTDGTLPAGTSPPYPWQAGARTDTDGSPSPSWLYEADDLRTLAADDPGASVVFVGDSITAGWYDNGLDAWDAVWKPRGALALGIVGDTTQNLLWRIANGELSGLHPSAVVLLIGTNDYGAGWDAAQVAQGIEACAQAVRTALPGAALILLTVYPRDNADDAAAVAVRATNAALAAATLPTNTTLVDMTPTLAQSDGAPVGALFSNDLLHPSALGYELIAGRLLAVPALAALPASASS